MRVDSNPEATDLCGISLLEKKKTSPVQAETSNQAESDSSRNAFVLLPIKRNVNKAGVQSGEAAV